MAVQKTPPKPRDQEIWDAVRIQGRTQDDVAGQQGLSQVRVSKIVRRIDCWIAETQPQTARGWRPDQQRTYTNHVAKLLLAAQFQTAAASFAISQQPIVTLKERVISDCVEAGKVQPVRTICDKITKTVPQGDVRFLQQQMKLVLGMRDIDLAQALLPVPRQSVSQHYQPAKLAVETRYDPLPQLSRASYMQEEVAGGKLASGSAQHSSAVEAATTGLPETVLHPAAEEVLTTTSSAADELSATCSETPHNKYTTLCQSQRPDRFATSSFRSPPPVRSLWSDLQREVVRTVDGERKSDAYLNSRRATPLREYEPGGAESLTSEALPEGRCPPATNDSRPRAFVPKHAKWTFYDRQGNITDVCPWGG